MGLCVGSSLIGNNRYNVNSLKIRTLFTDIRTVSWTVSHSLNDYIIDSVYQWFSKYGPWTPLKVHKTLHEVKTSVIVTLSYHLPFSFSFRYECTVDFSWSYMVWDIATDWIRKQMKIQLYSIKANIKEICKDVKLRVLFTNFFCFRKYSYFSEKLC